MYSLFLLTSVNLGIVPAREIPVWWQFASTCWWWRHQFFLPGHGWATSSCKIWLFLIDSILGTESFNNRDWSFIKLDHWQAATFLTSRTRYWRFLIVPNLEEASSDSSPVEILFLLARFFRTMLRVSRKSWGMLLHLPLLAMSTYRITPVNI